MKNVYRHRWSALLSALLIGGALLGITGCARENEGDLMKVRLMLDWVPNVNHVGIFVADELGYFADAGLDVEILIPGEVYPAAAVLAGEVEFGIDYQEYLTLLSEQEQGLVSIAAILQSNTSGFAVRADSRAQSIADLDGLRYGTFQTPFEEPTLRSLLRCAGIEEPTVEFVPAGTDLLTLLESNLADLVWIFYGTQGFQAERLGIDITYFPLNEHFDCIPDYYTPLLITSHAYTDARPDVVRAFVSAITRAHYTVIDNPTESAAQLVAVAPEYTVEEVENSIRWLTDYMLTDDGQWGLQDEKRWVEYAQWMHDEGVLAYPPTASTIGKLFSNEFADPNWQEYRAK